MNDCQILSPNMKDFSRVLEKEAYEKKIPLHGVFELTARCNFNCNMCYVHLTEEQISNIGRELTNEEWLEIARQARDAGMLYLTLTGGEVFVRPGFKELYIELSKMGFLIQIYSNGYMIDETVMEWLREYPPYSIRFTLYGTSNETYEAVCGIKNGFDRVSHAIDLILEAKIPFYMVATIVKENQKDIRKMYEFAAKKRILFQHTTALVKSVRGATADVDCHRVDVNGLIAESEEPIKRVERIFPKMNHILESCRSYRKSFWLTWNGKLQLCSFMEYPAISVIEHGFQNAWKLLLDELDNLAMPKECNNCKYEGFCRRCPGVLAAECGGPDKVSKEFCEGSEQCYKLLCLKEE